MAWEAWPLWHADQDADFNWERVRDSRRSDSSSPRCRVQGWSRGRADKEVWGDWMSYTLYHNWEGHHGNRLLSVARPRALGCEPRDCRGKQRRAPTSHTDTPEKRGERDHDDHDVRGIVGHHMVPEPQLGPCHERLGSR